MTLVLLLTVGYSFNLGQVLPLTQVLAKTEPQQPQPVLAGFNNIVSAPTVLQNQQPVQAIQNGFNNIVAAPVASKRHQLDARRSLLSRAFSASGDVDAELSNGGIAGLREGGLETLDVYGLHSAPVTLTMGSVARAPACTSPAPMCGA